MEALMWGQSWAWKGPQKLCSPGLSAEVFFLRACVTDTGRGVIDKELIPCPKALP